MYPIYLISSERIKLYTILFYRVIFKMSYDYLVSKDTLSTNNFNYLSVHNNVKILPLITFIYIDLFIYLTCRLLEMLK